MYDIIVIGGGPAGLTAALYALRANKTVLIIEKNIFGGQITFSPKIENYPGFSCVSGNELADSLVEQVLAQGAEVELEEAVKIEKSDDGFKVITDCNEYTCRSVISALGAKHRLLNVSGEDKFIGNGVSFCAVCDGAFYENEDVAVIGGGNSALQEALLLSDICKSVTVVQNLDFLTGEQRLADALENRGNVEIKLGSTVSGFIGGDELEAVIIKDSKTGIESELKVKGVFVAIGLAPENGIIEELAELDKIGYAVSDESCTTKTKGVFVAGDCRTKKVRQIATAVADGASSALAACEYIDSL
ncbi:MAG: FAD-dependent oxidoreductase [Clostridiales bacterium]|nr:FAD-dependent oxidoreductase [Clostridiales bacterium]